MYRETLCNRFPSNLFEDISIIENALDLSSEHRSYQPFNVKLQGSILKIPSRIYVNDNQLTKISNLTPLQKEIVYCTFSRHHDGFVREKCLKKIVNSNNFFVAPYIIQLLGEYVLEIIEVILENKDSLNIDNIISYIRQNPLHYEQTKQRVYSYWDCYYRRDFPKLRGKLANKEKSQHDYPGIILIKYINAQSSKKIL